MKAINAKAQAVMDKLTQGLNKPGESRKVDNTQGAFMAVCVEQVAETYLGPIYSIAHYYQQNGEPMRDPDMEFIRGFDSQYYPISFWQDGGIPRRDEVLDWEGDRIKGIRQKLQEDLADFANMWMRNIKEQQGL